MMTAVLVIPLVGVENPFKSTKLVEWDPQVGVRARSMTVFDRNVEFT